jgi:hypothetical protein
MLYLTIIKIIVLSGMNYLNKLRLQRSKKLKENLEKDTFGAAVARVIIRVFLVYVLLWIFQRMAGNP